MGEAFSGQEWSRRAHIINPVGLCCLNPKPNITGLMLVLMTHFCIYATDRSAAELGVPLVCIFHSLEGILDTES